MPPRSLHRRVKDALADEAGVSSRAHGFGLIRPKVEQLIAESPGLGAAARRIKLEALARNDELVGVACERMRANGMRVFLAPTAADAVEYVASVFAPPGLVVKSKSNMAKEMHLVDALADLGLSVIETDLGDRINQLAGTTGFHVLSPAVSVTRQQVRDLFAAELGEDLSSDLSDLVAAARRSLRGHFAAAEYGLVGANAVAADTGSICLMENEGNIRLVTTLPRVVVVVAAITKVVATLDDALVLLRASSVFAGGQNFANYVTCLSGSGEGGPEEIHVVLVDGGRRRALAQGWAEAFACVNCGSCLNFCPVYDQIGDAFAGRRVGGIGAVQTWLLEGREAAEEGGASLCIKCGKCRNVCPVQLDTPGLLTRLAYGDVRTGLAPAFGSCLEWMMAEAAKRPGLLRAIGKGVRVYQKTGLQGALRSSGVLDALRLAPAEKLLPRSAAPKPVPPSLPPYGAERARVLFFRGCLGHEFLGRVTEATLEVLRRNGCVVITPREQVCCGAIHEHAGALEEAKALARKNIDACRGNELIINNSGGCGATLKEYSRLLADDDNYAAAARQFASRVRDLAEFLDELGLAPPRGITPPVSVTYQDSCHLSLVQGVYDQPRRILSSIPGVDFRQMQPREFCCGSGGLWGLKYPELAERLRRIKLDDARATGAEVLVTGNPGCHMHLQGEDLPVVHLAEVLAAAYRGGRLDVS